MHDLRLLYTKYTCQTHTFVDEFQRKVRFFTTFVSQRFMSLVLSELVQTFPLSSSYYRMRHLRCNWLPTNLSVHDLRFLYTKCNCQTHTFDDEFQRRVGFFTTLDSQCFVSWILSNLVQKLPFSSSYQKECNTCIATDCLQTSPCMTWGSNGLGHWPTTSNSTCDNPSKRLLWLRSRTLFHLLGKKLDDLHLEDFFRYEVNWTWSNHWYTRSLMFTALES